MKVYIKTICWQTQKIQSLLYDLDDIKIHPLVCLDSGYDKFIATSEDKEFKYILAQIKAQYSLTEIKAAVMRLYFLHLS